MTSRMLRLVLADDHRIVRESLAQALRAMGHDVVGEAASGDEAVRLADEHRPDCVVLDVAMPGMDGIAAARRITSLGIPTITLTMHADDDTRERAAAAGVRRVLTKDCSVIEVNDAVSSVVPPPASCSGSLAARDARDRGRLTPREAEILRLLASGATPREVSEALVISMVTVKNHLASIYRKLGCRGRTGAVMYAYRNGLVSVGARGSIAKDDPEGSEELSSIGRR